MPRTTLEIKVKSVRERGGKVVLHGDGFDEALAHATKLREKEGLTFVHLYDDPDVIAGQGTVGMQILRQQSRELDAIFIPVGGGGLAAGIAAYVKYVRPEVKIIAELEDAAPLQAAMLRKRRVTLWCGLFADGVAVRQIGKDLRPARPRARGDHRHHRRNLRRHQGFLEDTCRRRARRRPGPGRPQELGAKHGGKPDLVAIQSGANVNFDRLRHVSERAELGEQREAILAVTIPERPGAFRAFCQALGRRGITEFNYRYSDDRDANIFVGIQLRPGGEALQALMSDLEARGYPLVDMSHNEMAKLHIRHWRRPPGRTWTKCCSGYFPSAPAPWSNS